MLSQCRCDHLPMHLACPGSGAHSPFSIHVVVLGPANISPGGHVKLKMLPSVGGIVPIDISLTAYVEFENTGYPQVAINI